MSQFPSALEISESWEDCIELPTLTPKAKHGEIYQFMMIVRLIIIKDQTHTIGSLALKPVTIMCI